MPGLKDKQTNRHTYLPIKRHKAPYQSKTTLPQTKEHDA